MNHIFLQDRCAFCGVKLAHSGGRSEKCPARPDAWSAEDLKCDPQPVPAALSPKPISGGAIVFGGLVVATVIVVALNYWNEATMPPEERARRSEHAAYELRRRAEENARHGMKDLLAGKTSTAQAASERAQRDLKRSDELWKQAEAERRR